MITWLCGTHPQWRGTIEPERLHQLDEGGARLGIPDCDECKPRRNAYAAGFGQVGADPAGPAPDWSFHLYCDTAEELALLQDLDGRHFFNLRAAGIERSAAPEPPPPLPPPAPDEPAAPEPAPPMSEDDRAAVAEVAGIIAAARDNAAQILTQPRGLIDMRPVDVPAEQPPEDPDAHPGS